MSSTDIIAAPTPAPFRASWKPKLAACPKWRPQAGGTSPEAERGTAIHHAIEAILEGRDPDTAGLPPEDIEAARWAADATRTELDGGDILAIEAELALPDLDTGQPILTGHADVIAEHADGTLIVLDFKTGQRRDYWAQGIAYAAMALRDYGRLICDIVFLYADLREVDRHTVTFAGATAIVWQIIRQAQDEDAAPIEGPQCAWCANRSACPLWQEPAEAALASVAPDWAGAFAAGLAGLKADPIRAGHFRTAWTKAKKLVDDADIDGTLRKALEDGQPIPGWRLSHRSGRRTMGAADFLEHVAPALDLEHAAGCLTVNAAKAEAAWAKSRPGEPLPVDITEAEPTVALIADPKTATNFLPAAP